MANNNHIKEDAPSQSHQTKANTITGPTTHPRTRVKTPTGLLNELAALSLLPELALLAVAVVPWLPVAPSFSLSLSDVSVVVGLARDKPKAQFSLNDKTSPTSFVASISGQENPRSDGAWVIVIVTVEVEVNPRVDVDVIVLVNGALQDACRGRTLKLPESDDVGSVSSEVVLGGSYERPQSVPRTNVPSSSFEAVIGTQVKPSGSSSSSTFVTLIVLVRHVVVLRVVITVFVSSGHLEQNPFDPQYAMSVQHSLSQQVLSLSHDPPSQQISVFGL